MALGLENVSASRFLHKVSLKRPWALDEIPMPNKPFKLPVILSPEEVMHFLGSVHTMKHRAILMAAYAAGWRVSEATHLKVTDIDSQRMMLRVDQGKGGKDWIQALVRANFGVAFMPMSIAVAAGLAYVTMTDVPIAREIGVLTQAERPITPALQAVIDALGAYDGWWPNVPANG